MIGIVIPLIGDWMAYCNELKTLSEVTRTTEAAGATPPDHSRSVSVSSRSPDAAPAAAEGGVVPGTVKTLGSLVGRPAAARKSVMSEATISVWPTTARVTPFPVYGPLAATPPVSGFKS